MDEFSLYIHMPFCIKKCLYCDFNSGPENLKHIKEYVEALKTELNIYSNKVKGRKLHTIFFGGGTPSAIEVSYIEDIMKEINLNYDTEKLEEVTIEVNPGTCDIDKFERYKKAGINRISIGLQTTEDELLKKIGRIHTYNEFLNTFNLARKAGFDNINVDLMFNLPSQTIEMLEESILKICKLDVEHISFYSLKIEDDTEFERMYSKGEIEILDDEQEREMYHRGIELLIQNKYEHYEISNFAKKDKRCKHNLVYWKMIDYIGIGVSASSNIFNKRFSNTFDIKIYIKELKHSKLPIDEEESIEKEMEMAEYMFLNLRLSDGVIIEEFKNRFEKDILEVYESEIEQNIKKKLIEKKENRYVLTKLGKDISNSVFADFMPEN